MRSIVLASTSPYRRELLQRLRLPFLVDAPQIDESALPGEAPRATALRLAQAKARAVATRHIDAIVIGSDQVADLDGSALSKPGSHARALAQLESLQGRTVVFHTALAVLDVRSGHSRRRLMTPKSNFALCRARRSMPICASIGRTTVPAPHASSRWASHWLNALPPL